MPSDPMSTHSLGALALGWLATYLLHSTILLSLAWAATRALGMRKLALQDVLLKVAIVGGILTSSMQLALRVDPLAGRLSLGLKVGEAQLEAPTRRTSGADTRELSAPAMRSSDLPSKLAAASALGSLAAPRVTRVVPLSILAWLLGSAISSALVLVGWARLRRRLAGRIDVRDPRLSGLLARIQAAAGLGRSVRLTESDRIDVPIALGLFRQEICLPSRVRQLPEALQRTILAHELGHLVRRDPAWIVACRALQAILCPQPLNRIARRTLQETSEYLCDDWAVARTGEPFALARCLAQVADWLCGDARLPVAAMAREGSALQRRVRRLLERRATAEAPSKLALPACAAVLLLVACAAPSVALQGSQDPAPSSPRAHVETAEAASKIEAPSKGDAPSKAPAGAATEELPPLPGSAASSDPEEPPEAPVDDDAGENDQWEMERPEEDAHDAEAAEDWERLADHGLAQGDIDELARRIAREAERYKMSGAEIARLRAQAEKLARAVTPEMIARIEAEAQKAARAAAKAVEGLHPTAKELEELSKRLSEAGEAFMREHAEERERILEEARRYREQVERQGQAARDRAARLREERARDLASLRERIAVERREIEEERRQLQRAKEDLEKERQELEKKREEMERGREQRP